MLIFVENITNRLRYTFDFIFKERDLTYEFTTNKESFINSEVSKFNYSRVSFDKEIKSLTPSSILFREGVYNFSINKKQFYKEECLTINDKTDPFASIFYIITRYEEYNSTLIDHHGRHEGKHSVLYRFNWHHYTMCDRWAEDILAFFKYNCGLKYENKIHHPQIVPTFDIDKAYAYKHKNLVRSILSNLRDLWTKNTKQLQERKLVISGSKKDPFDNFDLIYDIQRRGYDVKLFWLLGNYGKFDKNISHKHKRHIRLIMKMAEISTIGIHPSYKSNSNEFFVHQEIERLQNILSKHIRNSRQHFLKLTLPHTYETLIEQEIENDFTMGYADICGYRAGTARKHLWFNVMTNEITKLKIYPFAYMDGTLNEYLKMKPEEAQEKIAALYMETKKYGGDFTFIWHNDTINDYGHWKGWSQVLEFTLRLREIPE